MKHILTVLLIVISPMAWGVDITTESQVKVGKMENGNFFMKATPFDQTYKFNERFTTQLQLGVEFTAPRSNKRAMNHYANTILVRNELTIKEVIVGLEFNWSNAIEGASNEASAFDDTYQSLYVKVVFK